MPVNSPLQRQMAAIADQHFDAGGKCAFCGWGNSHTRQFANARAKHLAGSTPGGKACDRVPAGVASALRALQAQHQQQQLFAQPPNSAPAEGAAAAEAADLAGSKRGSRAPARLADELAAEAEAAAAAPPAGATTEAVQRLYDAHFTFTTLTAVDGLCMRPAT
ncbi:hypothetical protein Rsub_08585 [Raphidocelis subcapitata]|uniref:Uncharacterized protein n=1 Tax=Raphidocelis subcapitata TaxID=307507 RepID=A0A2V0PCH5_9CHLO|nr:hypothetical protein Rsub_08585 [Raphidocelis subcapitata]|eukprot:GBF95603.1 hypothetical protein Rsub_08585 [Raphidocelis subcapitata]